ncbi:MAG: hypothetical protein HKN08_09620 [Gammaproteobacteria bacterium]|nr:hypothetical protein [Gammaproteobacteria bacterium]
MVFDYYHRLGKRQKSIYRKSDTVERIVLNHPGTISNSITDLKFALETEDRKGIEKASHKLVNEILSDLKVVTIKTRVLSARPSNNYGELHGLYEPADGEKKARITVWMRTARHKKVVAFRTFLRTILHELCHHLDYEYLELADSFHTEGFFKRESSLFKQLVPK